MRDSRDTGSPWKDAGRKTPFRQVFTTAAAEVSEALNCEPSGERGCCRRLLDRRNPLQETGGAARGLVLLPRSSSAAHAPLGDGESGAEFPNSKGARPSTWASPWGGVPHPLLSDGLPPALSLLPNVAAARTPLRSARGETSSSLGHWKARGKEAKSGGELERAKSVSAQTSSALATPQAPLRRHPTALRPNPSAQSSAVGRETLRSHRPGALRSGLPSADKRPAETPRLWRRAEKSASGQVSEESLAKVAHFRATKVSAECALRGRLQRLTLGRRLFTSRTAKCQVLARRRRALEESSSPKASSALHEWRASGSLPTPSTATADTPPTFLNSFQLTAGQAAPSHLASRSPPRKRLQTSPLAARRLSPLALSDDDFALPPPARDLLMGSSASCEETTVSAQRPAGHSPSARSLMRRPPSAESASFSRRSFWAREGRSDSGDLPSQSSSSSRAVSGGTFSRKAACSSLGIVGEAKTVHRRRRQRERPGNSRGDKDETDGGGGEGKPARSSLSESLTADEEALLETFRLQRPWQSDLGFLNESGLEGVGNRQASAAVEWWAVDRSREEEEEEGEALRSASATSARALSPWQRCFDLHLDRLVEMSPWMAIPQRLTRSPGIRGGVCADTWRMDSDACLKMSGFASFAAAGRKGAARWSDLPLGLRLRVCWFLNGKELQALSASGRGGREAAGHSHSWMIRCTRRWAPCLAASAEQTRSLPFGKSPADRLALRRRLRSSAKQVSSAATETPAEAAAVAALAKNVGGEPTGVQHEGSPSRLCRRLASAVEESAFANAAREVSAGVLGAWLRKTGAEEARERRTDAEGRGCEFQGRSVFKAKDNAAAESGFSCARVRLGKMKSSRRDFQRQQEHRQEQTSAAERGGNGPWFSAPLTGESPCAPWDRWAAFHLNDAAMNFDYRLVLLSRNGWRAAVSAEWRSKMPPLHWTRRRVKANPSLVNTMDGRHQHGLLYLASEAYPRSGGPPVAELRTVSVADLQVQKSMRVPAKAINCLDVSPQVLVCGDDSGLVHVLDPTTLELRSQHHARASTLPGFNMGHRREVNDIRLCRSEGQALAVRTASRFPAGLELIDLETGVCTDISPQKTQGNWIHAVDVDPLPSRCPYNECAAVGAWCTFCCGGSSPLRSSSSSNVVAVGESTAARCFSLLRLDLRMSRPVVQQALQTPKMLWPLRVSGHDAFINSVFDAENFVGRIRQVDMRMADATPDEGTMPLASEDGTVSYRGGLLHVLHGTRVEDFRIFDGHAYVLQNDQTGLLSISRFNTLTSGGVETVSVVDTFSAEEWSEPLKLLLVYDQGWTCTYGNHITLGSMGNTPSADIITCPSLV